jgi:DnaJ-class molecular chaperone
MEPNYYLVLGVDETATPQQVHDAYRRLAQSHHPDVSATESLARFLRVQEAWDTLGDREQRRAYDRRLEEERQRTARQPAASARTGRLEAATHEGPPALTTVAAAEFGESLLLELRLTPTEAAWGCRIPLKLPA